MKFLYLLPGDSGERYCGHYFECDSVEDWERFLEDCPYVIPQGEYVETIYDRRDLH